MSNVERLCEGICCASLLLLLVLVLLLSLSCFAARTLLLDMPLRPCSVYVCIVSPWVVEFFHTHSVYDLLQLTVAVCAWCFAASRHTVLF